MSDFTGLYALRSYQETDKAFIMSTFLRGLYYGDYWFSDIPKDIFMNNYKLFAEKLIDRSMIFVACLPDEPDVILGYSMISKDARVIHFVYVKSIWRKRGIARDLCPKYPTAVTHLTRLGKLLLETKLTTAVFDPFAV